MKETDIWAPDEVSEVPVDVKETRKRPEFDVIYFSLSANHHISWLIGSI